MIIGTHFIGFRVEKKEIDLGRSQKKIVLGCVFLIGLGDRFLIFCLSDVAYVIRVTGLERRIMKNSDLG